MYYHYHPRRSGSRLALHLLLTVFTGGGWLVVLGIRCLLVHS